MPGTSPPFFVLNPPTNDTTSNRPTPVNWVVSTISTMINTSWQNVSVTGGKVTGITIDNSVIGGTTPASAKFSTLSTTGQATFGGGVTVNGTIITTAPFPVTDYSSFVPTTGWIKSLLSNYNIGGLDSFSSPMPSFDYLFHAPDCIPPGQYTRNIASYRTMNTGFLQALPANTPRMDHNPTTGQPLGLIMEESRANLLLQSGSLTGSPWTANNNSISTTTTIAPDGSTSAFRIVPAASQSTTYIYQTFTGTANTAYTISCYFKAGELTVAGIELYNGTDGDIFASYDLVNAVVASKTNSSSVATIKSVGNGWYRCTLTFTITGTANLQAQFARNTGSGSQGVFAWGPQVEAGSFVTSYIPTTSTTVTRPADNLTVPLNTAWFNPNEGTVFVDTNVPVGLGPGGYSMLGCFTDGTNSNTITLYIDATPNFVVQINGGGSAPVNYVTTSLAVGAQVKVAFNYTATTCAISVNGSTVASQTRSTTFTGLTTLNIGAWYINNNTITSTIRRFCYIPRAVSSTQLQYLTS